MSVGRPRVNEAANEVQTMEEKKIEKTEKPVEKATEKPGEIVDIERVEPNGARRRRQCAKPDVKAFERLGFKVVAMLMLVAMALAIAPAMAADYTPKSQQTPILSSATSQSVTNGQAVTLAQGINPVIGIRGELDGTNVVTIATPDIVGRVAVVAVGTTTNCIQIADSGTVKLEGAWTGDDTDTLTLISTATNIWTEISRSNN